MGAAGIKREEASNIRGAPLQLSNLSIFNIEASLRKRSDGDVESRSPSGRSTPLQEGAAPRN